MILTQDTVLIIYSALSDDPSSANSVGGSRVSMPPGLKGPTQRQVTSDGCAYDGFSLSVLTSPWLSGWQIGDSCLLSLDVCSTH